MPAKAIGSTIYIRVDGSIDPSTAPISTVDNITYTLIGSVASDNNGIVVERDDIVIEGAGFMLQGTGTTGSIGIDLRGRSNVTIRNINIEDFGYGFLLYYSSNNAINESNIANCYFGIWSSYSENNSIRESRIEANNGTGICLVASSNNNSIIANMIIGNNDGIMLESSSNNNISLNNIVANNDDGVFLGSSSNHNSINLNNITANKNDGIWLSSSLNCSICANNVTNNWYGMRLYESSNYNRISLNNVAGNYDGIILGSCSNNSIILNSVTNNTDGITLGSSSNNSIKLNNVTKNWNGIALGFSSKHNSISLNNLTDNSYGIRIHGNSNDNSIDLNNIANNWCGARLYECTGNVIISNFFLNDGLYLWNSSHNVADDNVVNGKPLVYFENMADVEVQNAGQVILVKCSNITIENLNLSRTTVGIELLQTTNTKITKNTITKNRINGILLELSSNNSISGNNITNNGCGLSLWRSSHNKFYHNNLIGNTQQISSDGYANIWDYGYPSGGNYWSDYSGLDLYNNPNQNKIGSDGIGDSPLTIDANNTDCYPLIAPINVLNAGTWAGVACTVNVVSNSTISNFHFNPSEGPLLKFNVTGTDGTVGFCRVTIPKNMLWADDGWEISVGNQTITNCLIIQDENYTYLYFVYKHNTETVTIQGTHVVPEFGSAVSLPLLIVIFMLTVILAKKKLGRRGIRNMYPKSG
jgi:parallel beta-helix repeat protein